MFRQCLAAVLSYVVLFAATPEERTRKLTEQFSSIPLGAIVEVNTIDNQRLKGRIGPMTETGFSAQTMRSEKVETVAVEFKNAKSVKLLAVKDEPRGSGKKTAGWIVVGGLAALGTLVVIAVAVAAAGS